MEHALEQATPVNGGDRLRSLIEGLGEEIIWEGRPDVGRWKRDGKLWLHAPVCLSLAGVTLLACIPFVDAAFDAWQDGEVAKAVLCGLGLPLGIHLVRRVFRSMNRRETWNERMERQAYAVSRDAVYRMEFDGKGRPEGFLRFPFGVRTSVKERAAYVLWPRLRVVEVYRDGRRMTIEGVAGIMEAIRTRNTAASLARRI